MCSKITKFSAYLNYFKTLLETHFRILIGLWPLNKLLEQMAKIWTNKINRYLPFLVIGLNYHLIKAALTAYKILWDISILQNAWE